jgi:pfkB domain protein
LNTHLLEINRAIGGAGGVTAVGEHTATEVLAALKAAKKNGATTSFDLNYRHTLWSKEAAQAAMVELMPYIDVIIGNEEAYDVMNGGSARVKR